MTEALNIPIENIDIRENSYLSSIIDLDNPVTAAIFPYSQHFIIKQDLEINAITDKEDLNHQIDTFLSSTDFKTMSGDDIKKPLYASIVTSSLLTFIFIIFLLIKLLL
jgi:hypothetical protein